MKGRKPAWYRILKRLIKNLRRKRKRRAILLLKLAVVVLILVNPYFYFLIQSTIDNLDALDVILTTVMIVIWFVKVDHSS